jgi:hypothetical protein
VLVTIDAKGQNEAERTLGRRARCHRHVDLELTGEPSAVSAYVVTTKEVCERETVTFQAFAFPLGRHPSG